MGGALCTSFYLPYEFVGGDYLSALPVNDKIYFIMADVVGHGVFSAFYSAMLHSSFNNLVFYPESIEEFISRIHREFMEIMEDDSYLTLAAGTADLQTRSLNYISFTYPVFTAAKKSSKAFSEVTAFIP